jgi:zinc transport system permease protein
MFSTFFHYTFIQNALIVGTLIAIVAPIIGQYLIVRRFSALADTLSHVSLVGVAVSFLFQFNPIISALVSTIIASLSIEFFSRKKNGYNETILTLFLTGALGATSILISLGKGFSSSIYSYLFGSINTISVNDIWLVSIICVVVFIGVLLCKKQLFIVSLDQDIAQSQKISPQFFNTVIVILAAFVVSIGIQIIGILLISSLMILPVLTAMQYKKGFYYTMYIACICAVLSVWFGILLSFYCNIATGGTIVMVNILFYMCSSLLKKVL